MVDSRSNRLPVRLVQQNGDTIRLDVTAYDLAVEREHSQIPVPFGDGMRFGIDLNMPTVSIAMTGVIVDDEGDDKPALGSKASIDVGFEKITTVSSGSGFGFQPIGPGGGISGELGRGGFGGGGFSQPNTNEATGFLPPSWSSNVGSRPHITAASQLHGKYFELPVAHWPGVGGGITAPTEPAGTQTLWLKADAGITKNASDNVTQWDDQSGNGTNISPSSGNEPYFSASHWNGNPAVKFNGSNEIMPLTGLAVDHALNSPEVTIFAVVSKDYSLNDGIIISTFDTGTNRGYELKYDNTNVFQIIYGNGSGITTVSSSTISSTQGTHILSVKMEDTTGNDVADDVILRHLGLQEGTSSASTYAVRTGSMGITLGKRASFDPFNGEIAEIIIYSRGLTDAEIEQTEAYLANKYGLTLDSDHAYYNAPSSGEYRIKYIFDANRRGSVKAPFAYLNTEYRDTDMTINSYSTGSGTYTLTTNIDPRLWIESNDIGKLLWRRASGSTTYWALGWIVSVSATQIVVRFISAPNNNDIIAFERDAILSDTHQSSQIGQPVIAIPISDLMSDPPTYNNGTTRDLGGANSPIEYLAVKIKNAIQLTTSLGTKVTNPSNSGTSSNDAFTVTLHQSESGPQHGLVKITQKVLGELGVGQNGEHVRMITNNFTIGKSPVITNFSGGRSRKIVKSAGDKVQDLMGLINNMQNYYRAYKQSSFTKWGLTDNLVDYYSSIYDSNKHKDYIDGLQLPFLSSTNSSGLHTPTIPIISATPSGSNTVITTTNVHGLIVGDQIRITNFSIFAGTMAVDLTGEHTVSAVASTTQFTISTASTSNTGMITGLIKKIDANLGLIKQEQRNFFVTHGSKTFADLSSTLHSTHASEAFAPHLANHQQSGIRAIIDEFTVNFNAEQRLYEFDMTMVALDFVV